MSCLLRVLRAGIVLAAIATLGGSIIGNAYGDVPTVKTWATPGGGNWSAPANWAVGVPGGAGDQANFTQHGTSTDALVNLDVNVTLGMINFNHPTAVYTLGSTGGKRLTFDNGANPSVIHALSGSHVINVPVAVGSRGANIAVDSPADSLRFGGELSAAGPLAVSGNISIDTLTMLQGASGTVPAGDIAYRLNMDGGTIDDIWGKAAAENVWVFAVGGTPSATQANYTLAVGQTLGTRNSSFYVGESGTGSLTVNGTIDQGNLGVELGNEASGNGTIALNAGGALKALSLVVGRAGKGTILQNGGSVTVVGDNNGGTLLVSSNGGSGTYTMKAGTVATDVLQIGPHGTAVPAASGLFDLQGGSVAVSGNLTTGGGSSTSTSTLAISGGTLTVQGETLIDGSTGGTNIVTQTGGTANLQGGLVLSAGFGSGTGSYDLRGGSVNLGADITGAANGALKLNGGTLNMNGKKISIASPNLSFLSGTLRDVGGIYTANGTTVQSLTKSGTGTLVLAGTNTYTGATTVNAGTLLTTKAVALPGYNSSGKVVFNGGVVGVQVGGSGWTTGEVNNLLSNATKTSGALGIDTTNGNSDQWTTPFTTTNFGPALGLAKLGPGTLTLDQDNSYTGGTTVNQGTLQITKLGALPVGRALTIEAGGTVVLASGLSVAGANGAGTVTHSAAAVPEAGTVALLITGLAGLAVLGWTSRRQDFRR